MTYLLPNQRPGYQKPSEKKSRKHPESALQKACVRWFDYQYPTWKRLLYANANGGKRSGHEAKIMHGEGVRVGVPDLTLAIARGDWHGLYVEMKILPNQPTDEQKSFMELLTRQGYYCQVVYTFEQFQSLIINYLNQ